MARDIHVVHNDMPVLALRGLVVFPGMSLQFEVGRRRSIAALRAAMEKKSADSACGAEGFDRSGTQGGRPL